jgi:hypothetical protein
MILMAMKDEDVEVYINGVLALKTSGFITRYDFSIDAARLAARTVQITARRHFLTARL